uniref:F-box domain-containing protein n=1 Tax=Lepeophtheirus salmonis TaxID=72036 RepID=A0A0K2T9A3_LEPSM
MPLSTRYNTSGNRLGLSSSSSTVLRRLREGNDSYTTYSSAPTRRLNLLNPSLPVLEAKSASSNTSVVKKETRRVRKKREWIERKECQTLEPQKSRYYGDWALLPDLILQKIFQYIPYQTRLVASLTCINWSKMVYINTIWSEFVVHDSTFTNSRFNYAGKFYEEVLNHLKASRALNGLAPKLKHLSFRPTKNLHVVVSFQQLISKYCEFNGPLPKIQSFSYVFPCDFARKSNEIDIYGTGGTILQDMKDLLNYLPGIKKLELKDLELDTFDATHVLDEVSEVCCLQIENLKIVNISRSPLSMLAIATFINLQSLTISPHNISDDLVECFGDMKKLRNVQILTNAYTECRSVIVDYRIWRQCRRSNPKLRVHLITEGKHKNELTFQNKAPIKSIVYDTPYSKISAIAINLTVEMYKTDLEIYAHKRLPRFHTHRGFVNRPDSAYLYLVRQCPYLHTLMIRERISSATVLLLAYTGKNLRYFHVRKTAIILKCDWKRSLDWSDEFYSWLRKNSRTYEDMEREVSQIFGFRWYALSDKQFKLTPVNVNVPYFYEGFDEAYATY